MITASERALCDLLHLLLLILILPSASDLIPMLHKGFHHLSLSFLFLSIAIQGAVVVVSFIYSLFRHYCRANCLT